MSPNVECAIYFKILLITKLSNRQVHDGIVSLKGIEMKAHFNRYREINNKRRLGAIS